MEEGKRQKQVAAVVSEELNDIFRRLNLNMIDGGMVSISAVKLTPDLLEARIYVSMYKVQDENAALKKIENQSESHPSEKHHPTACRYFDHQIHTTQHSKHRDEREFLKERKDGDN